MSDDFKTTILEKDVVLFDGNGLETGRHIKCVYYVERFEYDGETDIDYWGTVYAECFGCGAMIQVDTVCGRSLQDLKNDFGYEVTPEFIEARKKTIESYGFEYDGPKLTGDSTHGRIYCSDKCRKRIARGYQRDRQPKPCQHCGEILKTSNPKAKFCSAKCRVANKRNSLVQKDRTCDFSDATVTDENKRN